MPKFIYTAKSFDGQTSGGEIDAKDEKTLAQQLRSEGYLVTSIKEIEEEKVGGIEVRFLDRFKTVPLKEKVIFAKNLSVMISSGVTVSKAILNLQRQTKNKTFKVVLLDVYDEMQAGQTFSDALGKYPRVFNELFVNMVRVGETGGNLDEILKIISVQLEKEHDLLSKVRGAMIYPSVIVVAMIGIAIIMMTFILPKLIGVFKDMNVDLPASTKAVIAISDFMANNTIAFFAILLTVIVAFAMFLQRPLGKKALSLFTTKAPIISDIVIKVNCARFSRIFSSLIKSGIPVTDALKIISNTLTNYFYKKALTDSVEQIQKGISLSSILAEHEDIFPVMVSQIVQVGEETGKTDVVLMELAKFYEDEVDQITKNMSSIIEPVLMIVIGAGVGFFAIAMLKPMYSLMDNIK